MDERFVKGRPFSKEMKNRLIEFLKTGELDYDDMIQYSVCLVDDEGEILATGSSCENVLKCLLVREDLQGNGYMATVVSDLLEEQIDRGNTEVFIYTKPENEDLFRSLSFYTVMKTEKVLFMSNEKSGFQNYKKVLYQETPLHVIHSDGVIGAAIMNCNPFTNGHRYLTQKALEHCDYLHLFVLEDARSTYPARHRYQMVKRGVSDLSRVILHRSGNYMVSAATFPTYFYKDKISAKEANYELDLQIFARLIAPELKISKRFVGTEPYCSVTSGYNAAMHKVLPGFGIEVIEIPRLEIDGCAVSASQVRQYINNGHAEKIKDLVPDTTLELLCIRN